MRKTRNYPLILGVCLILTGALTLVGFQVQAKFAARQARAIYDRIEDILPPRTPGLPGLFVDSAMPVLELEGTDFCGILEIPAYGVRLPIGNQWRSGDTRKYPCRFRGSVYDNTLAIGGSDQAGQLPFCDRIQLGERIVVTDLMGMEYSYCLTRVDRNKSAEAVWLTESEADLTIFVRDATSLEYLALRCELQE